MPNRMLDDGGERLARAIPALSDWLIAEYHDGDRKTYLDSLFPLELAAGRFADARKTIQELRRLQMAGDPARYGASNLPFEIYAAARAAESAGTSTFVAAFRQSFREAMAALDDISACKALYVFHRSLATLQDELTRAVMALRDGRSSIPMAAALDLVRKYELAQVYESFQPLLADLSDEDDGRRYRIEEDVPIKTPEGTTATATVFLPRAGSDPRPALLTYTIYTGYYSHDEARRAAAHGYASVVAYPPGKGRGTGTPVPYEHDGSDAAAVIAWIAAQPWSDGRVGMYGGSYSGFTCWAAAKHRPPALKAIMESVSAAPGIDVPMEGNVFLNFVYPWPLYTTSGPLADDVHYEDRERWNRLYRKWYLSGASYRSLDRLDGTPNPVFRRWLDHPAYDGYWQAMIPYQEDFAGIDIPVLSTDGFLEGQGISSFYYFTEHRRYNPRAEHYYVIGPFNHFGAQRHPADIIGGYVLDEVARIDIEELRFAWFDYVFRHGPRPALLADSLNYEVMGADVWKHVSSPAAMSNGTLRYYLSGARDGDHYRLAAAKPAGDAAISLTVDFADRSDVDMPLSGLTVNKTLDTRNGVAFVSERMMEATEISGLLSGRLDFLVNKRDMDVSVAVYEWMPGGEYLQLPSFMVRASYAQDRTRRRLLTPGKRQTLAFRSSRLVSRRVEKGSRLIVVLSVNKEMDMQINYGSGKDVSDETIADAGAPLQVKWYCDSFVQLPIRK